MSTKSDCLSHEMLTHFVLNRLQPDAIARVESHLEQCVTCLHQLDEVERATNIDAIVLSGLVRNPGQTREYDSKELIREAISTADFRKQYEIIETQSDRRFLARRCLTGKTCVICFPVCSRKVLDRLAKQTIRLPRIPGIVSVEDLGVVQNLDYYVIPAIQGTPLLTWCEDQPAPSTIKLFLSLVETLRTAHQHGYAHGGIQPDRVIVAGESPHLFEFGIALEEVATPSQDYRGLLHLLERVAQTGALSELEVMKILRDVKLDESFFDMFSVRLQQLVEPIPNE